MDKNTTRNVCRHVYLLNEKINHLSEFKTSEGKLNREQLYIMEMVSETPGLTQKELVDRLKKKQTSVSRTIQRMTDRGYLIKNQNHADMRASALEVTDKGEALLESFEAPITQLTALILKDLSPEEQKSFTSILQKIHL
ncbi:MarR family winged helix-turn-helix transcriptional regulator [Salinicoccus albus]|uniref:MarR family winged helix-turn-helix transcriptional regulator n=1 Tax=Salinicoccus albus TaxID=418756 RepID=UPI000362206A|nr:MarR family transcriptional regulator [Salinicoccus albus]